MDRAFGSGSPALRAKGRLRQEYDRLQSEIEKAQELRDRYRNDESVARDLERAKRELTDFVKTKGASFQEKDRKR